MRLVTVFLAVLVAALAAAEHRLAQESATPIVLRTDCTHGCLGPAPLAPKGHPVYDAPHRPHVVPALPRTGK